MEPVLLCHAFFVKTNRKAPQCRRPPNGAAALGALDGGKSESLAFLDLFAEIVL